MNHGHPPRRFRPNRRPLRMVGLALTLGLSAAAAYGQEATNTPAATQPGVGSWYLRERIQFVRMSDDPSPQDREIDKWISTTALTYGITRELSATLTMPLVYSVEDAAGVSGSDTEFGAGDASLSLKWRPFQWDLNPVDSVRVAFTAGVETPTGTGDLGSHSWDPYAGVIFTCILGRHGFNQGLSFKHNTGGDEFSTTPGDGTSDALRYDTAYLFRVDPAAYSADTHAATYLTLEFNGLYETNGDNEALLGPGILYEARTHALEATVGFPVLQDVDERPETDLVVTVGFRLLF